MCLFAGTQNYADDELLPDEKAMIDQYTLLKVGPRPVFKVLLSISQMRCGAAVFCISVGLTVTPACAWPDARYLNADTARNIRRVSLAPAVMDENFFTHGTGRLNTRSVLPVWARARPLENIIVPRASGGAAKKMVKPKTKAKAGKGKEMGKDSRDSSSRDATAAAAVVVSLPEIKHAARETKASAQSMEPRSPLRGGPAFRGGGVGR